MNFETIAAYLAGQCDPQEEQEIENWRQAGPQNEQDFQRWQRLWQASQKHNHTFNPNPAKAWQKINPAITSTPVFIQRKKPAHKNIFLWFRNTAAVLLLLAGISWAIWKVIEPVDVQAVNWTEKTSIEPQQKEIILADGTKIWLSRQSKLRYPETFSTVSRDVFLEGEAFFEVAANPEKPFLIHSQGSLTQVIGTSFHVRSYETEPTVEVNLLSGKVSFSLEGKKPDRKVLLKPGQKAVLNKAKQSITVMGNTDQNFLAWKTRRLAFEDTSLREALKTLKNHYQVDFTVSDSLLLNCRFTGTFNKAPLSHVLEVFAFGSDISYHKQGNQYILSGKGCK